MSDRDTLQLIANAIVRRTLAEHPGNPVEALRRAYPFGDDADAAIAWVAALKANGLDPSLVAPPSFRKGSGNNGSG